MCELTCIQNRWRTHIDGWFAHGETNIDMYHSPMQRPANMYHSPILDRRYSTLHIFFKNKIMISYFLLWDIFMLWPHQHGFICVLLRSLYTWKKKRWKTKLYIKDDFHFKMIISCTYKLLSNNLASYDSFPTSYSSWMRFNGFQKLNN